MRVAGGVQWGSVLIAGGPIPAAPTIESVSPDIGDTATANPGVVITGTFPGSLISVRFALGVTSYPATVTAHSPTSITVTTPALSIGAWDVVVTTRGGVAIAVEAYDAWDPVAAGAVTIPHYWNAGLGASLDGDNKIITNADQVGSAALTWTVRPPYTASDANFNSKPTADCASGAYADSGAFTEINPPFGHVHVVKSGPSTGSRGIFGPIGRGTPADNLYAAGASAGFSRLTYTAVPNVISGPSIAETKSIVAGHVSAAYLYSLYTSALTPLTASGVDASLTGCRIACLTWTAISIAGTWAMTFIVNGAITPVMLRWAAEHHGVSLGA